MAYLDLNEAGQSTVAGVRGKADTRSSGTTAGFSRLEWHVVALSQHDSTRSLGTPGRLSLAFRRMFGLPVQSSLADPRLEALRRAAIYARRFGKKLPSSEISAFHDAGYNGRQLQALMSSVEIDLAARHHGRLA